MTTVTSTNDVGLKDISEFLELFGRHYINTLNDLLEVFTQYKDIPNLSTCFYRIYERADKQKGHKFKDSWKIQEKVNRYRRGFSKSGPAGDEVFDPIPNFQIHDVTDIVGLTVVCVYLSDIVKVRNKVKLDILNNRIRSKFPYDPNRKDYGYDVMNEGYYAYHYVLASPLGRDYTATDPIARVWCEVQIKTVLHDAWAAKTHDLTYKPWGELDERLKQQISCLGNTLESIDRQSQLVKELITSRWDVDSTYRDFARRLMMIAPAMVSKTCDPIYKDRVQTIIDRLRSNADELKSARLNEPVIVDFMITLDRLIRDVDHNEDTCRLYAALACLREGEELLNSLLDRVTAWYLREKSITSVGGGRALMFKGLVYFAFGKIEEAINVTVQAHDVLLHDRDDDKQMSRYNAANNLAYYYAELSGTAAGKRLRAEENSQKYFEDAKNISEQAAIMPPGLIDTEGAMQIKFGKTAMDVRKGLELCKTAFDAAMGDQILREIAEAFYRVHERQAYRRILELD